MNPPDYHQLLVAIEAAQRVLHANAGNLNAADQRIRCLVNITGKETHRALLEAEAGHSLHAVTPAADGDAPVIDAVAIDSAAV